MITVFAMMTALWGVGAWLGTPAGLRWGMIGGLWAAVVALHLALPAGHALRVATGGEARSWLALGVVAGLVIGYRKLLVVLRKKAPAAQVPTAMAGGSGRRNWTAMPATSCCARSVGRDRGG